MPVEIGHARRPDGQDTDGRNSPLLGDASPRPEASAAAQKKDEEITPLHSIVCWGMASSALFA